METVINILILETEPSDTVAVLDELHRPDLKIGTLEIKRPADVLPKLEMNPPGAILACTREPDHALFELLEHLRESSRTLPVIVITARCEPGQLVELMECGAAAHVRRQNLGELADVIRYTLENPLPSPSMPEIEVVRELDPVESRSRAARGTCEPPVVRCICEGCSRIADASGEWERFNVFLRRNQKTIITLGLCPEYARDRADFSEPARPWLQPH